MSVVIKLEELLQNRELTLGELAKLTEIEPQKLSLLKGGKARAIRFETIDKLCAALKCQPSDLIEYKE